MKKYIGLSLIILLSACFGENDAPGVIPVQVPELPHILSKKAERLPNITDSTMGGQVLSGVDTDRKYNEIAFQLNSLIDVYVCVKDTINKNEKPENCFK